MVRSGAQRDTAGGMTFDSQRAKEAKLHVEMLKAKVARLQTQTAEHGAAAKGSFPRRPSLFAAWEASKKELHAAVADLQAAKATLVRLSGTTGSDPKWVLLREAWHVLTALDEAGIDIGERGHALIDEIEFHVPLAKLHEDIVGQVSRDE